MMGCEYTYIEKYFFFFKVSQTLFSRLYQIFFIDILYVNSKISDGFDKERSM